MRFIITAQAGQHDGSKTPCPEPGFNEALFTAYMKFNEEMHRAGILVASEGLNPGAGGARIELANGKRSVVDGPFAESKELVGGFYIIEVDSLDEAIRWALRAPSGMGFDDVLEVRPLTGAGDLPPEIVALIRSAAPAWSASWQQHSATPRNTICLWYDGTALDAARFYAATLPGSTVGNILHAPGDYPSGKQGDVLTVEFTVAGIPCLGLNGGPAFQHNEAFSFQIATDDQAETDRLWDAIVGNGGQESACGWCKDRWGVNWQITPRALTQAITDPDQAAARRAFEAMMTMQKIDIAAIEAARRGDVPAQP